MAGNIRESQGIIALEQFAITLPIEKREELYQIVRGFYTWGLMDGTNSLDLQEFYKGATGGSKSALRIHDYFYNKITELNRKAAESPSPVEER
jgi:hypothetical protein